MSLRSSQRAASALLLLLLAVGAASAQTLVQKSWRILNDGVANSSLDTRTEAVSALGLVRRNAHAEELAAKALADPKPEVRAAAATALGSMGASRSLPALKKAVNDADVTVVLAAARSMLALHDEYGYQVYYAVLTGERKSGSGLLADQRKMLSDPKKMAMFGFETGVGFIPFGGMSLAAYKVIAKDDSSPVRAAAAKLLADDPDPKSADALVAAADDKSWSVRAAAADAIGRRGNPALAEKLAPRLEDDKSVVRFVAAAAIIRLSESRGKAPAKAPAPQH
jgi:HEAT repeat protein